MSINFITGENFQELTEISFSSHFDCIKTDQLKTKKQNIFLIESFDPKNISHYKKIFIYTDFVHEFMHKFSNYLSEDTIIITHNSDCSINDTHISYLNNPKIKKWFCQNRYINHPKLFSLPIGIANSQWLHGNLTLLKEVISTNFSKENLIYKNFNKSTNPNHRNQVDFETHTNGFFMQATTSFKEYIKQIKQSYFSFAPLGNGNDCHRIWECLYLNCVPVVPKSSPCFDEFQHLPILFVDSYKDVTRDFLTKNIDNFYPFSKFNLDMLDLNYWETKINE